MPAKNLLSTLITTIYSFIDQHKGSLTDEQIEELEDAVTVINAILRRKHHEKHLG